jgi:hypothetical protein
MTSLWWFYQNLPLCKHVPANYETIQSKCPNIIREKVCDLVLHRTFDTNNNNNCGTNNVMQQQQHQRGAGGFRTGSGRILTKSFSCNPEFSKSLDGESVADDTNNNAKDSGDFRRATSSMCLNGSHIRYTHS